jgi:HSP20 family protein
MTLADSLHGLDPFFAEFDRLSQRLLEGTGSGRAPMSAAMPMDVVRRGDTLQVMLDVPGADPDSVNVTVDGRSLVIEATRESSDAEGDIVFLRGRSFGSVRRELALPEGLDLDAISASYDNGVLTVSLPVAESAKPRKVEISHSGGARQITQG